ncbi:MAG: GH1 family beta-glucosidase [Candidatus Bathyarchaeota archaeon]
MNDPGIKLPKGFYLGTASAAYQIEGATTQDGRAPSIWDTYVRVPGAIENGDTGDTACDHYNRYLEDVALMKQLGLNAYRFSVAWSRVIPKGRGKVNKKGLDFYSSLVDTLLEAGITPFLTLNHFDLPQALQEEGGGWLRREVINDFKEFTDIVTHELGDRVKHWTTFNEPWELAWQGYHTGEDAPGLRLGVKEALLASHNVYLSHGEAVKTIRDNVPDAEAGIVIHLNHVEPATEKPADIEAAKRWEGCQNRWYLDPIYRGAYPEDMLKVYGKLAPEIKPGDMETIQQPLDYLGLNMYRRSVIADGTDLPPVNIKRINPPGEYSDMGWEVYPKGLYDILTWTHNNYPVEKIYVTENGVACNDPVTPDGRCHDTKRVTYLREHIKQALKAREEGVPLHGYFAWSTMDNFEWAYGYNMRFGVIHVDYKTQKRTIKDSAYLLQKIAESL